MRQIGLRVSASAVAAAWGVGRRTLTTVSKAVSAVNDSRIRKTKYSSELRKFLGIPDQSHSDTALLISQFIKIYNFRSAGIQKDKLWEQNLQNLLHGKNSVGFSEIAKLLSPEFSSGVMNIKETNTDSFKDNTKGKTSQRKGKKK